VCARCSVNVFKDKLDKWMMTDDTRTLKAPSAHQSINCVSVGCSGAETLLLNGADANLLGTKDAAAIHLAAGAECHSEDYTALLLRHSANPNSL